MNAATAPETLASLAAAETAFAPARDLRLAVVHDALIDAGGAERVLAAIHRTYPAAPVFVPVFRPQRLPEALRAMDVRTSSLQRIRSLREDESRYLQRCPRAMAGLDLAGFDVVLRMPEEAIAARKALLGAGFMHLNGANTAAEVTTTVLDLAKFDIALDEGRLLGAESRERMWTPAVSNAGKTLPYALGWFVEEFAGRKVIWHYGSLPPCASALYVKVPAAELSFFLLACNERLSAFAWDAEGVRASPFARAFLGTFGLLEN